jgi:NIPSNAP
MTTTLRIIGFSLAVAVVFAAGYWFGSARTAAAASNRVFELRTYTATPGNLGALEARFRDHTLKLFVKHGMTSIGYWLPTDEPRSADTFVYMLAHKDRAAATASWDAFRKDPEWIKARDDSEKNGKLVVKTESIFMAPTDFSPIK